MRGQVRKALAIMKNGGKDAAIAYLASEIKSFADVSDPMANGIASDALAGDDSVLEQILALAEQLPPEDRVLAAEALQSDTGPGFVAEGPSDFDDASPMDAVPSGETPEAALAEGESLVEAEPHDDAVEAPHDEALEAPAAVEPNPDTAGALPEAFADDEALDEETPPALKSMDGCAPCMEKALSSQEPSEAVMERVRRVPPPKAMKPAPKRPLRKAGHDEATAHHPQRGSQSPPGPNSPESGDGKVVGILERAPKVSDDDSCSSCGNVHPGMKDCGPSHMKWMDRLRKAHAHPYAGHTASLAKYTPFFRQP